MWFIFQVEHVSVVICVCSRTPTPSPDDKSTITNGRTSDGGYPKGPGNGNNNLPGGYALFNPFNNKTIEAPDKTTKETSNNNINNNINNNNINNNRPTDKKGQPIGYIGGDGKPSGTPGETTGGRRGEQYVGKIVLGSQVRIVHSRDFFRTIIQTPRTQHTQWHALR